MDGMKDFEAFESEDTMSILNRYIEEAEINLDKSKVFKNASRCLSRGM